jgi:phospholipase C
MGMVPDEVRRASPRAHRRTRATPQRSLHRMRLSRKVLLFGALFLVLVASVTVYYRTVGAEGSRNRINHVIVVYQENWSFDSLYGDFPGVNGLDNAGQVVQLDPNGVPYTTLPQTDPHLLNVSLPVAPFDLSKYIPPDQNSRDLVHRFYQEQIQIDGGKMDKFVEVSDAKGLALSYFDATNMPEGKLAQQYTIADNFFHAAFGGSFLNHFWLVCACSPVFPNAPTGMVAQLDASGNLVKDGAVTPDGYAVNTSFTVNAPHPAGIPAANLVPEQTMPNIGDRLSNAGVSWAWYSGGWNDALAGHPDPLFQFHHQPFAYFANYADGTAAKAQHLKDETDFFSSLSNDSLPAVSFVKPLGPDNEHPGYTNLVRGQQHVADIVAAVQKSKYWQDTAIIVTYDENGGRWDHVAPPVVDRWGPGTRVPAIIISPFAKKGFVDHTQYDTTSILRFIEKRWHLQALGTRDLHASDLSNAFDDNGQGNGGPFGTTAPLAAFTGLVGVWGALVFDRKRRVPGH